MTEAGERRGCGGQVYSCGAMRRSRVTTKEEAESEEQREEIVTRWLSVCLASSLALRRRGGTGRAALPGVDSGNNKGG